MKRCLIVTLVVCSLFLSGCASVAVSGKRFGSVPEDARHFVQSSQVTLYPTLEAAWSALETGYVYRTDDWYIIDRYGQYVRGGDDTWLMPSEVQTLINAGVHGLDCEDGAIWLTSALRRQGIDAWLCVGSVILDSGVYGHAWCMVNSGGAWTLYETTTGQIGSELPSEYRLSWRTDGKTTWINILSSGVWQELKPIPPDELSKLRDMLKG